MKLCKSLKIFLARKYLQTGSQTHYQSLTTFRHEICSSSCDIKIWPPSPTTRPTTTSLNYTSTLTQTPAQSLLASRSPPSVHNSELVSLSASWTGLGSQGRQRNLTRMQRNAQSRFRVGFEIQRLGQLATDSANVPTNFRPEDFVLLNYTPTASQTERFTKPPARPCSHSAAHQPQVVDERRGRHGRRRLDAVRCVD